MTARAPSSSRFTKLAVLPLGVALALAVAACGSDGSGPEVPEPGTPPSLPAATSMTMDFGLFGATGGSSAVGTHFITAGLTVAIGQALTALHLAVPAVVLGAAASNTPSFESDGLWHWRYSASHQGQVWTSHLSGSVQGNNAVWDVRITAPQANPPLDEFVWFSGTSATDGSSGVWRFFDPANPSSSTAVAQIDWTHGSNDVHQVSFTATSGPNTGDVLTASHDGDDRLITFFDVSANQTSEIGWNIATKSGYILAPNYNNGLKSCWDGDLKNIVCS